MGAGEEYQMYSVKASLSLVPLSNDEMGRYFASYQEIEEQHYERWADEILEKKSIIEPPWNPTQAGLW